MPPILGGHMFTDTSDNRRTDGGDYNEAYIQRNQVKAALDDLRNQSGLKKGSSRRKVLNYGAKIAKAGLGNCLEIAAAGAHVLQKRLNEKNWDIVMYAPKGDHIFLVIGDTGELDDNFNNWPADTAIFDGWAKSPVWPAIIRSNGRQDE